MNDSMKQFIEMVSKDEDLKERIKGLGDCSDDSQEMSDETKQEIIAIAKERGIDLNAEDFVFNKEDLSDEELAAISGGSGGCGCAGAGYGQGSKAGNPDIKFYCGCALVGVGVDQTDNEEDSYCLCSFVGGGADTPF